MTDARPTPRDPIPHNLTTARHAREQERARHARRIARKHRTR